MLDQNQKPLQDLTPQERKLLEQGVKQDDARALQEGTPDTNKAVQQSMLPQYPNWPTSKRGPQATPPPPGQRSYSPIRREQVTEVGYNQETGVPSTQDAARYLPGDDMKGRTGFDQLEPPGDLSKKRKERL